MKLYLIERQDRVDWDEFAGFVVRAENEEQALELCFEYYNNTEWKQDRIKNNLVITELLKDGDAEVILSDFNAG